MKTISNQDLRTAIECMEMFAKLPCERNNLKLYNKQRRARLLISKLKEK